MGPRPAGRVTDLPSMMQALSNLIDHGMTVQEAVEAPRIWTQGHALELETSEPMWRRRCVSTVTRLP